MLRLAISARPDQKPLLPDRDLRALMEGSYHASTIVWDIDSATRVRLGDIRPETMTNRELLERYFVATGIDADRMTRLFDLADDIMDPDYSWQPDQAHVA